MIDDVIDSANGAERASLGELLKTHNCSPTNLRSRLQSKSTSLWEKVADKQCPYSRLLSEVAASQGVRRYALESERDFEARLVRTAYLSAVSSLSDQDKQMLQVSAKQSLTFKRELVGAGSIAASQLSGFGVYQMATTLLGAASASAGVTVPFLGYMALTKGISVLIGPVGWVLLGTSLTHKATKPKWAELLGVVAWMCMVRERTEPRKMFGTLAWSEIARKAFKVVLFISIVVLFLCAAYR